MNQIAKEWQDYEVIDTGNKEKLERWNQTILRRPDPVAIWPIEDERAWNKADAVYHRSKSGGGHWEMKNRLKNSGQSDIKDCALKSVRLDLNTQDFSPNKPATGILWPIKLKNLKEMI